MRHYRFGKYLVHFDTEYTDSGIDLKEEMLKAIIIIRTTRYKPVMGVTSIIILRLLKRLASLTERVG